MLQVRVILRDISGKFSWDASVLYSAHPPVSPSPSSPWHLPPGGGLTTATTVTSPPRHTTRQRPAKELPTQETAAEDLDQLADLLQYLGHTSPELLSDPSRPLDAVQPWPGVGGGLEGELIAGVVSQRNTELDTLAR